MLPKVPKGFITNFPNAVPDFIGPRQFIFLLCFVGIFLLISIFILSNYSRLKTVSQNILSPQVRQINTIIAEIENPPEEFLKQIDPILWQIEKEGILDGVGDPDKELVGLNDIKEALVKGQSDLAKKRMRSGIFRHLSEPMPTKGGGTESVKKLEGEELNRLDPERKLFLPVQSTASVSRARYRAIVDFVSLYYSL